MAKVRKRIWATKTDERTAWIADYFAPGPPDGEKRRHTKTSATKKEANAWLAHPVVEIKERVHNTGAPITDGARGRRAMAPASRNRRRATVRQYRQHLDLHIKPFIGHHKVCELTPGTITSFRNVLIRHGRSRTLISRVVSSLGSILAEAMANGQLARNVVREQRAHDCRWARVEKRHERRFQVGVDIPTKDELRGMLEHARRLRPLLVTAVFTGLRASELRGLAWDAVDLEQRVLTVRQRADRWNTIGSPKSDAGKREVPDRPQHAARMEARMSPIRRRRGGAPLGEK